MRQVNALVLGAVSMAAVGVAACSSADESDGDAVSCDRVVAQASYETMRQLAASGLATDPAALLGALPGEPRTPDGDAVKLPEYRIVVEQFDDAERATLLSSLASARTGVGGVFDEQVFYASISATGECAGWTQEG